MKLFVAVLVLAFALAKGDSDDEFLAELRKRIPNNMWQAKKVNLTEERLRRPMGWLRNPRPTKNLRPGINLQDIRENYVAPESFDAREEWPQCESIKKIWDQSRCGSCYAFATANSMSDRLCIHKDLHFLVSPEDALSCCTYDFIFQTNKCGDCEKGGYVEYVLDYFVDKGYCSGGAYGETGTCKPYSISPEESELQPTPECVESCSDTSYEKEYKDDIVHGSRGHYAVTSDENAIKEEIQNNGPVVAGFDVYTDFFYYTSGIYQKSWGDLEGGHAVRIIGWGTEDNTPYWIVSNSYGEYFGENGIFRILRGSNHCNFESYIRAALP